MENVKKLLYFQLLMNAQNAQKIKNVWTKNVFLLTSALPTDNAVLTNYVLMENVSQKNGNAPILSVNQTKNVYMENVSKIM